MVTYVCTRDFKLWVLYKDSTEKETMELIKVRDYELYGNNSTRYTYPHSQILSTDTNLTILNMLALSS